MGNSKSADHHLILREMPAKVRELHYAVMSNDRIAVTSLTSEGVNVNFPWYNPTNPSIKDGSTPLICAVSLNHIDIVEVRNTAVWCSSFNMGRGTITKLSASSLHRMCPNGPV